MLIVEINTIRHDFSRSRREKFTRKSREIYEKSDADSNRRPIYHFIIMQSDMAELIRQIANPHKIECITSSRSNAPDTMYLNAPISEIILHNVHT